MEEYELDEVCEMLWEEKEGEWISNKAEVLDGGLEAGEKWWLNKQMEKEVRE